VVANTVMRIRKRDPLVKILLSESAHDVVRASAYSAFDVKSSLVIHTVATSVRLQIAALSPLLFRIMESTHAIADERNCWLMATESSLPILSVTPSSHVCV
jgi:hypothetical protein